MRSARAALVLTITATTTTWAEPKLAKQAPIAPAAAAMLPVAGRLVSYHEEDQAISPGYQLVIARLTKQGPVALSRTPVAYQGEEAWLDAHTLVVVSHDDDTQVIELSYFVDGVADATRARSLKNGEAVGWTVAFHAPDKSIWLRHCLEEMDGRTATTCNRVTWLRVDTPQPKASRAAPAKATAFSLASFPIPTAAPPANHRVVLTKIKSRWENKQIPAIACTNPTGTTTWSYESMIDSGERFTPKRLAWVSASPPIYSATGAHENPVGWRSTQTYYFRACDQRELEAFAWLDGGLWAESSYSSGLIKIFAGKHPIATFTGAELRAAPR